MVEALKTWCRGWTKTCLQIASIHQSDTQWGLRHKTFWGCKLIIILHFKPSLIFLEAT
jgi:hypothetical protein